MSQFAVTITYLDLENNPQTIVLDTVEDSNVQTESSITTYPIVSGDAIADHMYKEPISMSIRGTFSLNGKKGIVANSEGVKLAAIEELFEEIKNEGIFCEVVKISIKDDTPQFSRRSNMVLTSIAWTEKINSLGFTFNFTQVMLSEIQEYTVDTDDAFLPNVNEPATLSFTESLLDWELVDKALIETLFSWNLITSEFLTYMSSLGKAALIGIGIGSAVAIALISALSISGPVGWIVGAVVAGVIFIAGLVKGLVNIIKRSQYKIQQFKLYKQDKKNQAEVKRFGNFVGEVHKQFQQLNNVIACYQVSSNEPQECIISILNDYYIFTFTKNNTSGVYSLNVVDINETSRANMSNVQASPENWLDCTSQNSLFRADTSGAYVYLICPSNEKDNLENYFIVVSEINPDDFNALLSEIIKNALKY